MAMTPTGERDRKPVPSQEDRLLELLRKSLPGQITNLRQARSTAKAFGRPHLRVRRNALF
jgi:hypothetical protein